MCMYACISLACHDFCALSAVGIVTQNLAPSLMQIAKKDFADCSAVCQWDTPPGKDALEKERERQRAGEACKTLIT